MSGSLVLVEELPPEETATCRRCGETKPLVSGFDRDRSQKKGFKTQCKTCRRKIAKERRNGNGPVKQVSPEEVKKSAANREAILRLIDRHRAEFNSLVYSEQVRSGIVQPGDRPVGSWVTLV